MPKRTYDAIIIHAGADATIHFPREKYVYGDLKNVFKDGSKVTVTIASRRKPRSLSQNAYLHLCLQMIADESGNDLETVKSTMKALYAKKPMLNKNGEEIFNKDTGEQAMYVQDTSAMSTVEALEFTENVRLFAAEFLNLHIPLPDEQIEANFK